MAELKGYHNFNKYGQQTLCSKIGQLNVINS